MKALLCWIFTPLFLIVFGGTLSLFHIPLVLAHHISLEAQRKTLEAMNWCLIQALSWFALTRFKVTFEAELPRSVPLIIVANHQSMFDIPLLVWYLRKSVPHFIAKQELGKGLPSISYALRTMFLLIDRKDPASAVPSIHQLGKKVHSLKEAVVLFPEGTRARDGVLRKFKTRGFTTLCEAMPDALIVPVAISNSWQIVRYNLLPVFCGAKVNLTVFAPIVQRKENLEDQLVAIEAQLRSATSSC